MIDSHCHLDNKKLELSVEEIVQIGINHGLIAMVNTGYDLESSKRGIEFAQEHKEVYATVGIHPHDAKGAPADYLSHLEGMANEEKVVAIGEIGLDYYYEFSPKEIQKKVFIEQMELAMALKKPFVIHQRDAMGDMLEILENSPRPKYGAVFHCYSGSADTAKKLINMGYQLSIAGPVTFKNARKTIEVIQEIPLDYLMVETDCPYLTPEPFRGKVNYPHLVKYVIEKIAEIKKCSPITVAEQTTLNSKNLFRLGIEI